MSSKPTTLTSYQFRLLSVLVLINFVNFAARLVFPALIPQLRNIMNVSDAQLGSLQTRLLVVLAIASIPSGFLADRFSRKGIIAVGILFWSAATFAGGFAGSFMGLLFTRSFVGLGEAAYAPAAQSMISGAFPQERRAFAQAIFAMGMLLGGACGQEVGGIVGEAYGWQMALFVVALAGVIPAIALFWVQEPPRGPRSEVVPIAKILSVPAFLAMIGGGICITFASVSIIAWAIDFAVSYKSFTVRQASVTLSIIGLVSALIGVLCGGFVADRLQKKFPYGRLIAIGMALLLATPFLLLAIQSEEQKTVLIALFIAGFFMSWYHGPVTAVIHDMMPRRAHSTSIGIYMFATQLLGGLGPEVIGKISDQRDLQVALQLAAAILVCGALLMLLVIHFIRRDGLRHPAVEAFHAEPPETPS
jgi:MFS transporter, Spinster family, sphingosine-1-phosphate transporter